MTNQQLIVAWIGVGFTLIGIGTVSVYIYNKVKK